MGADSGEIPGKDRNGSEKGPKGLEPPASRGCLEFGEFRIDLDRQTCLRSGEPVRLTPKVFDLLVYLAGSGGRLVTKEELLDRVWSGTFVEEGIINRNVSTLRRSLGEEPGQNVYVETVPKRGYRFLPRVTTLPGGTPPVPEPAPEAPLLDRAEATLAEEVLESGIGPFRGRAVRARLVAGVSAAAVIAALAVSIAALLPARRPAVPRLPSLAVLPFRLLDGARDEEAIGLGVADAVVTRLGASGALVVRPTSAVARFARDPVDPVRAGDEMDVDYVLDGKALRSGRLVRFTVQLLEVGSGHSLWTATFDEQQGDFLALQDALSGKVSDGIRARLALPRPPNDSRPYSRDPEAYSLYVRGRYLWSRRGAGPGEAEDAQRLLRQAIERDPDFAIAYVGLADCLAFADWNSGAWKESRDMALRALSIDERLGEAWATLGFVQTFHLRDWKEAGSSFQRSLEYAPNYATGHQWYGAWLALQGRFEEARAALARAAQIDPLSPAIQSDLAEISYFGGDTEGAIREWRSLLSRDPGFVPARAGLLWAYLVAGRTKEAERLDAATWGAASTTRPPPDPGPGSPRVPRPLSKFAGLPTVQALMRAAYGAKPEGGSAYPLARVLALAGAPEEALDSLERARDDHEFFVVYAKVDPAFRDLRRESRWQDVVRSLGLDAGTAAPGRT